MAESHSCPNDAQLQSLIDGALPADVQAALAAHLEICETCRHKLDALAGTSVAIPPSGSAVSEPADRSSALAEAMRRLKANQADETATVAAISIGGASLSFLAPSANPRHLGRLAGYEVLEVIGRGGMGIVLKARDPKLERLVAVKVLNPDLATSGPARARFLREARSAAAVTHEHVVTIHAVDDAGELPFLVMEYIVGVSLEDRIRRSGHLRLEEILRIGMQAALGLAAAHAQGLVHRDIKPSNILLENGVERVKITDFGLARVVHEAQITQTNLVAGTPQYMSPEQARGEAVDHRSDLFSLGCVLYAMCTGRSPFRAETPTGAIHRVCSDAPRPIREVNPDLPDWLAAVIDRLLEKKPADRFQTADEVAQVLGQYLAHVQQPSRVELPKRIWRARTIGRGDAGPWKRLAAIAVGLAAIIFLSLTGWQLASRQTPTTPNGPGPIPEEKGRLDVWIEAHNEGVLHDAMQVTVCGDTGTETYTDAGEYHVDLTPGDYSIEVRNKHTNELNRAGMLRVRAGQRRRIEANSYMGYQIPLLRSHAPTTELVADADVNRLDLSHDRTMCAIPDDRGNVMFWRISESEFVPTRTLSGLQSKVSHVRFSPDGTSVAVADTGGTIGIWDWTSYRRLPHAGKFESATSLEFSPDASKLAAADQAGTIIVWSTSSYQISAQLKGHSGPVYWLTFSPDNSALVSSGQDTDAILWDVATAQPRMRLPLGQWGRVAFSPDSKLLGCGSGDGSLTLRDITGKVIWQVAAHSAAITSVCFSPDGKKLLSCSLDSTVKLWDATNGNRLHTLGSHRAPLRGAVFSPDGTKVATTCDDQAIRLWDASNGRMLDECHAHWGRVRNAAFSQDNRTLVSWGTDRTVRLWDVPTIANFDSIEISETALGNNVVRLESIYTSEKPPHYFALSPNGRALAIAHRGSVTLTSFPDLQVIYDRDVHGGSFVSALEFLSKGTVLLTAGRDNIRLWDVSSGEIQRTIPHGRNWACAALSPDEQYLAAYHGDKGLVLRLLATGDIARKLTSEEKLQWMPAFSPDGSLLVARTESGKVISWSLDDYAPLFLPLAEGSSKITASSFSPDGHTLATGDATGTVSLWEVGSWRAFQRLDGIVGPVRDLSFSPDGRFLAAAGGKGNRNSGVEVDPARWDGRVVLWDAKTGRQMTQFRAALGTVDVVRFSVDGARLVTLGVPKMVTVWNIRELLEQAPVEEKVGAGQ